MTPVIKCKQFYSNEIRNLCYKKCILIYITICFCLQFNAIAIEEKSAATGKPLPKAATFNFPDYAYKETNKNELTYHEFEAACEDHAACENLEGIAKKACIRRCVSYSCYQDIYAFDELEEGEIDVRQNSFKGCVIQRTGHTNRYQKRQRIHLAEIVYDLQWKLASFFKQLI